MPRDIDDRTNKFKGGKGKHVQVNRLGTLMISDKKSTKVNTYLDWFYAWNVFLQIKLHFFPHEAPQLFHYQRIIVDLMRQYPFDAMYQYDMDHRQNIANEKNYPQNSKSVFWDVFDEELAVVKLRDKRKPPQTCYICKERGHIAPQCPQKEYFRQGGEELVFSPGYRGLMPPQQRTPTVPPLMQLNPPPPQPRPPQVPRPPASSQGGNRFRNGPGAPANDGRCRQFAAYGQCNRRNCSYTHNCELCGQQGHNANSCFSHTNTPFRPGP